MEGRVVGVGCVGGRWVMCGCEGEGLGVQLSGGRCAAHMTLWAQASPSVQGNKNSERGI